jgi:hypothetical protein
MSEYTWRDLRESLDLRELENLRELTAYTVQSQYAASEKILSLAAQYQEHIDPHVDIDLFYEKMFNIYTAEGVGLDNWGVILGIGRMIEAPFPGECFGFDRSSLHPFDQLPFAPDSGTAIADTTVTLDDDPYRWLLLYKAMANISASTAKAQNHLLRMLVNTGIASFPHAAYVLEVDKMVIRWVFEDSLTPMQAAVFKAAGTLARGAGVGWQHYAINPAATFGFDGSNMRPFNQASFASKNALTLSSGE